MFDFKEAVSHWITGPKISSLLDHGPWWYFETHPVDGDIEMVEVAENLLRIGYVKRETWRAMGEMVTRYTATKAGRTAIDRMEALCYIAITLNMTGT